MLDSKSVLIVSYSFPPANSPAAKRAYYFAKYLPEFDFKCFVLTARNQISSLGYDSSLDVSNINFIVSPSEKSKNQITSKQVIKSKFITRIIQQLLIPDRGIVWLMEAWKNGASFLRKNKDVQIVYATAPSFVNVLVGMLFKLFFRKKLIVDYRDFYFTKGLFKRIYPLRLIDRLIEYLSMKYADQLVFISQGMLETYRNAYPLIIPKSSLIYNGIDDVPNNEIKQLSLTLNSKLKFFYAGSFYFNSSHPRNIFVLLEVLSCLFKANKIPFFEVHIASNLTDEEENIFKNGPYADHIILLGLLSQREVEDYYQNVNCCLLILGNSQQDKAAIPIKVFEYFASQLPVLALVPQESEIEEIGKFYNGFAACFYDQELSINMQNIIDWLNKCLNENVFKLEEKKWDNFNRRANTEQLTKVFQL